MNKKIIATVGACALCLGLGVAGTLAWLTDTTGEVENTFTTSDIDITLVETDVDRDQSSTNNTYQMVPGYSYLKDPIVTVSANSEKCYLFIQVKESGPSYKTDAAENLKMNDIHSYLTYEIADGWNELKDNNNAVLPGVYYRIVDKATTNTKYTILKGDETYPNGKVTVPYTVTKEMMNAIDQNPTITFKAYAVQYFNTEKTHFEPYEAWEQIPSNEK